MVGVEVAVVYYNQQKNSGSWSQTQLSKKQKKKRGRKCDLCGRRSKERKRG